MKKFYILFLSLFVQFGLAQLSNFTLQVTATNETCAGNGTLSFSVANTTAGSIIAYSVYLLPNVTTPIANTTNSTLTGLISGNYKVVATQSLGADSNTQQQNVTLSNQIQNLTFNITSQLVKCGNDGILTATVTSGTAVSYELLSGPVTMPAQTTNQFFNLPVGNYSIRVFDTCGNAVVNSYTLIQNYTPLIIIDTSTSDLTCNSLKINVITNYNNSNIKYPLTVEFKVYPPNNAPVLTYTQTLTSFSNQGISQVIPRFNGNYFYDVKITDGCQITSESIHNYLNKTFSFAVFTLQGCTPKINISTVNAVYPYTIDFLISPPGYNPASLNPGFPGPYFDQELELNVIFGNYSVRLTDACGKTHTVNFQMIDTETPIFSSVGTNGCGGISFSLDPVYDVTMVNVTLISAPATYPGTLPIDMSSLITQNGLLWYAASFPQGNYVFHILDSCGVLHVKNLTVGPGQPVPMSVTQYPECEISNGSAYVYYSTSNITSIQITNAPSSFPFPLPYTITNSSGSSFTLINVPVGSYTAQMTTACGNVQTNVIAVESFSEGTTTSEIQQFCSSFNLKFIHQGNANNSVSFALQKFNPITGNWEHPTTGNQIVNNQINSGNFFQIDPVIWNINLNFTGKFRIIKAYNTISFNRCVKPIYEFEVLGQPKLLNYEVLSCGNNLSVVQLNATGIGQLIYRITQKNGQPFVVSNGSNNVFLNLQPATYNFQIEDTCGNILNNLLQITTGFSVQITPNLCENQISNLTANNFSFLQYEWWKDGNPTNILSNTNVLTFNPFIFASHGGTYYLRITHVGNPTSCLNSIMSYVISSQVNPSAGLDSTTNLCGSQNVIDLNSYRSGVFDANGNWQEITTSNGALLNGVWDAATVGYGVYKFKYIVNGYCGSTDEAIITLNIVEKPVISALPASYSVCKSEDLSVNSGLTNSSFTYQWTGPNGFSSTNSILQLTNLQTNASGPYTLQVSNGVCNSEPYHFMVDVIALPDFYILETCENNIKTLIAIPFEGTFDTTLTFDWMGPNGFTSTLNPIQIQAGNEGNYSATIQKNTCELSKNISITSIACQIQNGISPNGDGLNDYFDLSAFDVKSIKIYNRYGTEVYSKENGYTKEWYGQANNGNMLPDATYFYVLDFYSRESKTGWIYVIR